MKNDDFAGRVAVVTGANKGIGLAITQALAAEGAYVVAGSLSTENLDGLDRVTAVPVNLLEAEGPALLVQKAIDVHGRVDALVNNVGAVRIRTGGFLATSDEVPGLTVESETRDEILATAPEIALELLEIESGHPLPQWPAVTFDFG